MPHCNSVYASDLCARLVLIRGGKKVMPRMSQAELQAFLTPVDQCKLACLDDTGHPYVVPIMFHYHDGDFYIVARERSAWRGFLQRDGRVSLSLEDGEQRAQVKGHAEMIVGLVKLKTFFSTARVAW
jgi:hypothetical protein